MIQERNCLSSQDKIGLFDLIKKSQEIQSLLLLVQEKKYPGRLIFSQQVALRRSNLAFDVDQHNKGKIQMILQISFVAKLVCQVWDDNQE